MAELERQKRERQDERQRAEKASAAQQKALESIKGVVSDLEERKARETSTLRKQLASSHAEVGNCASVVKTLVVMMALKINAT